MAESESPSTMARKLGDEPRLADAWGQFYEYCFAIINGCPTVRQLPDADRDDCVQDVMTEIVRKLGGRGPEGVGEGLTGWIRTVSRNKAVDILRRRTRRGEVRFDDGSGETVLDGGPAGRAAGERQGEYVALVWEALLSLDSEVPVTSYLIFYLRTIEGWEVPELAELFGITPEQTRVRCHRVRRKFESILKAKGQARGEAGPR